MKVIDIKEVLRVCVERASVKLLPRLQAVDPLITGIHYEYGHYTDIKERLSAKNADPANKSYRWPLVAVFEDDKVTHGRVGFYGVAGLTVVILMKTDPAYTREKRRLLVFEPVLNPIYEQLLTEIFLSGKFNVYSEDQIEHTQINRPHWGNPAMYGNRSYLLDVPFDGIELYNLSLETFLKTC